MTTSTWQEHLVTVLDTFAHRIPFNRVIGLRFDQPGGGKPATDR